MVKAHLSYQELPVPSIRTFIVRLAEPQLLRLLLQRHGIEPDADVFLAEPAVIAQTIDEEIEVRTKGTRGALAQEIERIDRMATEAGEVAIEQSTLHDNLADLPSRQARALYVFLHDQDGFRRAEVILYADSKRGGREWTSFAGRKQLDLARDEAAMDVFKEALRAHFDTPNVHVDVFDRTRQEFVDGDVGKEGEDDKQGDGVAALTQITIYREDRPNTEFAFVEGSLGTQIRRPVLEAALTYEPATGLIECVGRQRDSREELARLMATTLLGCEPDFQPAPLRAYDLGVLKERLAFEWDPEDRIEEVRVALLRLTPLESTTECITVESLPRSDKDIWTIVDERLGTGALKSSYEINQARLLIRYRTADSNRARSLPITITHPHRSNIKDCMEIERLVANKYLPRWGLVAA